MRIDIYGDYIDTESQRTGADDITPNIFRESVSALEEGEEVEIHVNSCGGSVSAGISIANQIRDLKSKGHSTVCIVDGVAASIASVTAMACDEISMYPQSFLMIHNPFSVVQGDADELRKEAQTLDAMKSALVSFYRQKFNRTDEEIRAMMDEETWIAGADASSYGLNVTLLESDERFLMAARASVERAKAKFNSVSKTMKENSEMEEEKKEEVKPVEEVEEETPEEVKEEPETEKTEETETEEVKALKVRISELEEEIKRLHEEQEKPVEERLAKCQSVFQNKINNFKAELKAKDEELRNCKASVSSLENRLEETTKELHDVTAAFAEKKNALDSLNSSVLRPSSAKVFDKCSAREKLAKLPMNERAEFYSKHRDIIG